MKHLVLLLALSCVWSAAAEEFITVYKDGKDFFVRSKFSETEDLVTHNFRYANEKAYLIPRNAPITRCTRGKLLHAAVDDYPATLFPAKSFSTLGGNHGSAFARSLKVPGHGLTTADLGGVVTEKNRKISYIILQIIDKDHILIHPEGKNSTLAPSFANHSKEKLYYKGKELPFKSSVMRQLYPLNRITDCRLLADGKTPVPEKKEVKCRFVDFIFVHDVINPYHAVQSMKNAPGKKPLPEWQGKHCMTYAHTPRLQKKYSSYMKLPALATFHNKFRFEPRGANVNYRKAVYHVPLTGATNLDVMFMWTAHMAQQKRQLFYIPKLKPVTALEKTLKKNITIDLAAGYPLPRKLNVSYYIPARDALSPADLPDRFIRVSGPDRYHYGIALGYSLFSGCTAKGSKMADRKYIYHLYRSHKMYPNSYALRNIKPGTTVETVAYRQYFNPRLEPDATSFYCHHQGSSFMVYLDFHKELKNKTVKLPPVAAGKKITVLEKTPALTLHTASRIPDSSVITLSNDAKHGYLVLKLD